MGSDRRLLKINRNFVACFVTSAAVSSVVAQALSGSPSHVSATAAVAAGYAAYFGVFAAIFRADNKERHRAMGPGAARREVVCMIPWLAAGEAVYLAVRWPSMYALLEYGMEPFAASLASEAAASAVYMLAVSAMLRRSGML